MTAHLLRSKVQSTRDGKETPCLVIPRLVQVFSAPYGLARTTVSLVEPNDARINAILTVLSEIRFHVGYLEPIAHVDGCNWQGTSFL